MVELVYVGLSGVSHVDPPLGQLEPGAHVLVEDHQADRLLTSGNFERAAAEGGPVGGPVNVVVGESGPERRVRSRKPKPTTQSEPAQEV